MLELRPVRNSHCGRVVAVAWGKIFVRKDPEGLWERKMCSWQQCESQLRTQHGWAIHTVSPVASSPGTSGRKENKERGLFWRKKRWRGMFRRTARSEEPEDGQRGKAWLEGSQRRWVWEIFSASLGELKASEHVWFSQLLITIFRHLSGAMSGKKKRRFLNESLALSSSAAQT